MTHPGDLSDLELAQHAQEWRRQALQGAPNAGDPARAYEAEMRRRLGGATLSASLAAQAPARRSRPWWRFW